MILPVKIADGVISDTKGVQEKSHIYASNYDMYMYYTIVVIEIVISVTVSKASYYY